MLIAVFNMSFAATKYCEEGLLKGFSKTHFAVATLGLTLFAIGIDQINTSMLGPDGHGLMSSRQLGIKIGIDNYADDINRIGPSWLSEARRDFFQKVMTSDSLSWEQKTGARCVEFYSASEQTIERARQVCHSLVAKKLL